MSRGNIIQGQASGKLGDTVLMVRNGQQLQRVYTKSGARSGDKASEAARIQRVKFGSASNQWSLYRYVCTRMYRKGKKSTQSDYNYFVKRNSHLLPYFSKQENADGVHVLQPGLFSEGNLGRIDLLLLMRLEISAKSYNFELYDTNSTSTVPCAWESTVANLKRSLQSFYPNARKVTYLFSYSNAVELEEEGESFMSQQVTHDPVTIDLYKETTVGENALTVKAFFSSKIQSTAFSNIINAQPDDFTFLINNTVFSLHAATQADVSFFENMACLVFATDDNVSDCYSTILSEASVDPSIGVFALWHSYRTGNSLRIAADSYGYQEGVMRDDVASVGNDLSDAVAKYAARLRAFSAKDHAEFMTRIGSAEAVKPVTTRKVTAENKEG